MARGGKNWKSEIGRDFANHSFKQLYHSSDLKSWPMASTPKTSTSAHSPITPWISYFPDNGKELLGEKEQKNPSREKWGEMVNH